MDTIFQTYESSVMAFGAAATIMLAQLVVADVVGILRRHVPGTKVRDDHSDAHFRAARTVGNTNESIAIFICALLFCILSGSSPSLTAYAAWSFVFLRIAYAICYYANLQTLRSIVFALSALSLIALLLIGFFY